MKPGFNPEKVMRRLVDHYGLPAFLFEITPLGHLQIGPSHTAVLVPYAAYASIGSIEPRSGQTFLFEDLWHSRQQIVASQISRHAGYHEKISARSGKILPIEKNEAQFFMERYHLMGQAQAAYHYGLVHEKQLVAVASFSKGRKMNRLPQGILSYELIRLASLPNLTVTGNLSRMVQQFYRDHKAGDVMTYVDRLLGDKISFEKNGFELHGITDPITLWVNTKTHTRYFKDPGNDTDVVAFRNLGNYKLVKTFEHL